MYVHAAIMQLTYSLSIFIIPSFLKCDGRLPGSIQPRSKAEWTWKIQITYKTIAYYIV